MYQMAARLRMACPLKPRGMIGAFKGAKKKNAGRARVKSGPGVWIDLSCSFEGTEHGRNRIASATGSQCHIFGGKFEAVKYRRKGTLDISGDSGGRMPGDSGDGRAADALRNAAGLPPARRFYSCRHPSRAECGQPGPIRLNAGREAVAA